MGFTSEGGRMIRPTRTVLIGAALLAVAASVALAASWWGRAASSPIRIGYIGSLTGRAASLGSSARDGAALAVEELNAVGGVAGRPLVLDVRDDGGDPKQSLTAAKDLAAAGVVAIVGPFNTACATALVPWVDDCRVLVVAPAVAGSTLAQRSDWMVRLYPSSTVIGTGLADLARKCRVTGVAMLGDAGNDEYRRTVVAGFSAQAGAPPVLADLRYAGSARDRFPALAEEALASGAKAVVLIGSPLDAALLAQHLRRLDPGVRLLATHWSLGDDLIQNGGAAVEGMLFVLPIDASSTDPAWLAFVDRYRSVYGREPSHAARVNHDAVTMLARALASAGEDPEALRAAVIDHEHHGLQGAFRIDTYGDPPAQVLAHELRQSQVRRIEP
jgi:branched-chain amino acid transport system substrate-binding protein